MTTKVRDAAGVLRTLDEVKVRGPDGVLRTIDFIKLRGPDGVLREVYAAGGGGAPTNPAYITPGSSITSGTTTARTAYFTAYVSTGSATAYAWGVLDGPGTIISGGAASSAQLRVTGTLGDTSVATFFCDVTVGADTYRATCTMRHTVTSGGVIP